jgi:PKD repeat protein
MPNTAPRTAAGIAGLMLSLVLASSAAAAPTGDFTVAPAPPDRANVGETVQFNPVNVVFDGASTTGTIAWLYGAGEGGGATASHAYDTPGTYQVTMVLTNTEGGTSTVVGPKPVVVNAPPVAAFGWDPLSPFVGTDVHFGSESDDPDGGITSYDWNFDDGVTSEQRNPVHPFSTPGSHSVTLTVTDAFGATDTQTHEVVARAVPVNTPFNEPPVATFAFGPRNPTVGDSVEFVSSAVDPEGKLRSQTWDLDGDGQFDDARGDDVVYTFVRSGAQTVRLRVEDQGGAAAVKERTVTVQPKPRARAGFLSPSPVISLNGQILSNGSRIKLLRVRAPKKALVTVRCKGKSCPEPRRRKRIKSSSVRFKTYESFLRAGVKVEITVSKPGTIGTYTRYTIRAGKFPKRINRCLPPGSTKPRRHCA